MRLLFAPFLLAACGGSPDAPAPSAPAPSAPAAAPTPSPEADPPAAEEAPAAEPGASTGFDAATTFAQACGPCHGATGAGDGPASATLPIKPANFATAEFWAERDDAGVTKIIKEGGAAVGKSPLMAPFGAQFDDGQIAALVAHIHTLKE